MKKPKLLLYGIDGAQNTYMLDMVKKGKLPGFARIMKQGVYFSDMMSTFPTISPTCWNSIFTGAVPKVHGAVCQDLHYKTEHPGEIHSSYKSEYITAERFWETAGRKGIRSLVIDTLGAGHVKAPNVTHIRGGVNTKDTYVPGKNYHIRLKDGIAEYDTRRTSDNDAWIACDDITHPSPDTFVLPHTHNQKVIVEDFSWTFILDGDKLKVGVDAESAASANSLEPKQWSDVISRTFRTTDGVITKLHFRIYFKEFDPENRIFAIYVTGAHNMLNEVCPNDLAAEIAEIPEIAVLCGDTFEMFADTLAFYNQWKGKVIELAMEKEDYDIIVVYSDSLDNVNHNYAGFREGTWHSKEITQAKAEEYYETLYNVEGVMVEWLLDNVVGDDTQFAVASDHGGIGCSEGYHTRYVLADAGLLVYDEETDKKRNMSTYWEFFDKQNNHPGIDWEKTRAYPTGSCFVNVNLKGREPCGSVEPEDFDKTVAEIIRVLHRHDPDPDGAYSIAFAVPGEQAGFFGHGGAMCGDVVFGLSGSRVGGCYGGVHAHQIPSAFTRTGGDMRPICIFCGSKFKKNVILDRPADITDIAPTLCFAAGMPQPKDATGGVMFAAFEEEY